jgi:hypothetical protein
VRSCEILSRIRLLLWFVNLVGLRDRFVHV